MTSGAVAVHVKNVSHEFGEPGDAFHVQALQKTSLDIRRGELLCLIGPSGCGKSTLLNMVGGLLLSQLLVLAMQAAIDEGALTMPLTRHRIAADRRQSRSSSEQHEGETDRQTHGWLLCEPTHSK